MQIWKQKTTAEILKTLEMELAKAKNELKCLTQDAGKVSNRVNFLLTAVHALQDKDLKI